MTKVYATALALMLAYCPAANASMPLLTSRPDDNNVRACAAWAREQDEEAIGMWGIQSSGNSSYELGIHRLTSECLGEPTSDIVGFGSSVGFDERYCEGHADEPICQ